MVLDQDSARDLNLKTLAPLTAHVFRGRFVLKFLAEAGVAVISFAGGQQVIQECYINSN